MLPVTPPKPVFIGQVSGGVITETVIAAKITPEIRANDRNQIKYTPILLNKRQLQAQKIKLGSNEAIPKTCISKSAVYEPGSPSKFFAELSVELLSDGSEG